MIKKYWDQQEKYYIEQNQNAYGVYIYLNCRKTKSTKKKNHVGEYPCKNRHVIMLLNEKQF